MARKAAIKKKKPGSFRNQQICKRIQTNTIFVQKTSPINIQFTHKNYLANNSPIHEKIIHNFESLIFFHRFGGS